ncbi:MAG: DNA damage-inducible protein D [Candidatus Gracilibacteria bacterium]|nr:DNA damage-inducible protein D [Candidatus Gracilibacteria bacterium]
MTNMIFEKIKKINEYGKEFWSARDLMEPLGYMEWRKFEGAIGRAKESCGNSGQKIEDHFVGADKMIKIALGTAKEAVRKLQDYHLSRYACYLIAQNGDPRKPEIALAQTYFAIQTRRQEVQDLLMEDSKRVLLRDEIKESNKNLFKTAKKAGVRDYATFQDFGYMGLYGGLRQKEIHVKKKLKPAQKILDHMGSVELAANLFRATQVDAKIKKENIIGENKANKTHYDVGKKVRKTIKEIGGTMPEKLPSVEHVKESRKRLKNQSGVCLSETGEGTYEED